MATTTLLSLGYPQTLVQNTVYALPSRRCQIFSESGGTIEQSNTQAFSVAKAVTLDTNNQAEVAGGFIRQTSAAGGLVVTLKAIQ